MPPAPGSDQGDEEPVPQDSRWHVGRFRSPSKDPEWLELQARLERAASSPCRAHPSGVADLHECPADVYLARSSIHLERIPRSRLVFRGLRSALPDRFCLS
mgnify:CR=1 FL=1